MHVGPIQKEQKNGIKVPYQQVLDHILKEQKKFQKYIFNFSGNLYQKRIRVAFVSKIRNEEVFNNEEDLIDKMKKDCIKVESILSKNFIIENNKGLK